MGNIDTSLLSVQDRSGDVTMRKKNLRRVLADLMACDDGQGGLIVGTCSGIHTGMNPELVDFMYQFISHIDGLK